MNQTTTIPGALEVSLPVNEGAGLPDRVRNLYSHAPSILLGHVVGSTVVVTLYSGFAPPLVLVLWTATMACLLLYRVWVVRRFAAVSSDPRTDFRLWQKRWCIGALAAGAMWGCAALLFYHRGEAIQKIGLIITIYSFCVGAVTVMAEFRKLFLTFITLCYAPTILSIALEQTLYSYQLAGVLLVTVGITTQLGRSYRQVIERLIALKVRTEQLAEQLRIEKEVAEEARHAAEVANRAKTQFFAAASHDLRQPLHAVGLFAEALRNKSHDEEVIPLVNSINSSVDALEVLFSELLDITKIDTGAIESRPQNFSPREIFARQRLHYEPIAFEKGLELKFRGEQHFAFADPVLVDRILRNLISNAIRYTDDGGVLVSCRPRGDKLLLQVWDSGIGIRASEQARIFEEFYQVPADQPLPAHQRKGLGLGLAIVRRLAALMGAPLTIRSRPGHGTVFSLVVPRGRAQRASEAPAPEPGIELTLERRLIVVVDDDQAVRDGLTAMLQGWGATVAVFDSVQACRRWSEQACRQGQRPDLAIVDYQLDHASTGIDALVMLREQFGQQLPAVMVTGSTTATLDAEARTHDFHLLIKPVLPNKLRAVIAFKFNTRSRP